MKKILSMVLALMVVMSCMTVAFADETPCTHDNATYTVIDGTNTHTFACPDCQASETQDCIDALPEDTADDHCDLCEQALNHEDAEWYHYGEYHELACTKNPEKFYMKGDHKWGDWAETKAATEDAKGEEARECEICSRKETRETDKLEHEHEYTDTVVAPTCEEKGYTEHKCECGYSYKDAEVPATDHTWGEWKVTKEATYKTEGEKERVCSIATCKKVETAKIDKVAHECVKSDELANKKDATCTEDGYTGDVVCKLCDKVLEQGAKVSPTGHDKKTAKRIDKVEATCKKEGYTGDLQCQLCKEIIEKGEKVKKLGHNFVDHDNDPKTEKQCSRCKIGESSPDTGDSGIMIPMIIMVASLMGIGVAVAMRKKVLCTPKN